MFITRRVFTACKTKIKITAFNIVVAIDMKKRMNITNNHEVTLISENENNGD